MEKWGAEGRGPREGLPAQGLGRTACLVQGWVHIWHIPQAACSPHDLTYGLLDRYLVLLGPSSPLPLTGFLSHERAVKTFLQSSLVPQTQYKTAALAVDGGAVDGGSVQAQEP